MPAFVSPPDPRAYNAAVWRIVRQIPTGKVITYGQIARLIPVPIGVEPQNYLAFSPRWVGSAMSKCPEGLPWQRVVNAQGKISLRSGEETSQQRQLLEAEGVIFDDKERIDLTTYGWDGQKAGE